LIAIALKENVAMQHPKCDRRIPDDSGSCLFWRVWVRGEASSEARTESPMSSVSSGKMREINIGIQVTKEEIDYRKLEGPPLSIRARVEEVLKKEEGQSEEIGASCRNIHESKERAGRKNKRMGSLDALKFLPKEK
jgi:hypothetical protein